MSLLDDRLGATSIVTARQRDLQLVADCDDDSIVTVQPSTSVSNGISAIATSPFHFDIEQALQESRAYRMVTRDTCDNSFVSSAFRTNAWSVYLGLTLANISVISVLALPLFASDISNPQYYNFGTRTLEPGLAELSWMGSFVAEVAQSPVPELKPDTTRSVDSSTDGEGSTSIEKVPAEAPTTEDGKKIQEVSVMETEVPGLPNFEQVLPKNQRKEKQKTQGKTECRNQEGDAVQRELTTPPTAPPSVTAMSWTCHGCHRPGEEKANFTLGNVEMTQS